MKTTIKKMIKLGLKKEDIKKELSMNDEQVERYISQGRVVEIDNLPEILEKYNTNKVFTADDRAKSEIFDKLFNLANEEIPTTLDMKEKSEIISAFPKLIEDIKANIAKAKIANLQEQINILKEEINNICKENNLDIIYPEEELGTIKTFTFGKDIHLQSKSYKLGKEKISLSMSRKMKDAIELNEVILVEDETASYLYKAVEIPEKYNYIKFELKQD